MVRTPANGVHSDSFTSSPDALPSRSPRKLTARSPWSSRLRADGGLAISSRRTPPTPLVDDESTAGYMLRALWMPARAQEAHDRAVQRANSQWGDMVGGQRGHVSRSPSLAPVFHRRSASLNRTRPGASEDLRDGSERRALSLGQLRGDGLESRCGPRVRIGSLG